MLLTVLASSPILAGIDYQEKSAELMPVDCLLPGTVRKLGGRMTYVTQRRAVKTSGVDCEIRGGEYVLYDRASYQSALAIWQPLAESGDARAQNFVGEIYEKGLGVKPDYALAAQWYEKAAAQDYNAAQINLGQLYERGLGVEHNMEQALAWYRASSGIKGKALKFVSFDYSDEKIAAMERQISDNDARESQQNRRISELVAKLDRANNEKQLTQQRLSDQEQQLAHSRTVVDEQRDLLTAQQSKAAAIRSELKQQLAAQQAELDAQKAKKEGLSITFPDIVIKFDRAKLSRLKKQLAGSEKKVGQLADNLSARERELSKQELALKQKDLQLAQLSLDYDGIQHQLSQMSQKQQLAATAKTPSSMVDGDTLPKASANTAPVIEMIEPPLLATRGEFIVKTRSGLSQRTIIGQISASNGLMDILVNDKEVSVDEKGLFQSRIPLEGKQTKVEIVAVDTEGLRSTLAFKLERETSTEKNLYGETPDVKRQ